MLRTKPLDLRRFQLMALEHIEKRAARMTRRREELGLTQEEVADRIQDIHKERFPDSPPDRTRGQMVSNWERAINEPSARKLELLAEALDWTVADLNVDQPDKTKPTPDPFSRNGSTEESGVDEKLRELEVSQAEMHSLISENQKALADLQESVRLLLERGGSSQEGRG